MFVCLQIPVPVFQVEYGTGKSQTHRTVGLERSTAEADFFSKVVFAVELKKVPLIVVIRSLWTFAPQLHLFNSWWHLSHSPRSPAVLGLLTCTQPMFSSSELVSGVLLLVHCPCSCSTCLPPEQLPLVVLGGLHLLTLATAFCLLFASSHLPVHCCCHIHQACGQVCAACALWPVWYVLLFPSEGRETAVPLRDGGHAPTL